jgi:phenylalanyl-tRNA synthetase beta chain
VALEPAGDGDLLWRITIGGAVRGEVRRVPLDAPVWASPAFGVELELAPMSNSDVAPAGEHAHGAPSAPVPRAGAKYRALPTTPASEFDLALLVPNGVRAAEVERVIRNAAGDLLERLVAFDLYEGAGVEPGHRSVAWRLTLRHPERTLRDKEIDGRRARILSALQTELNVRQRST